MKSTVVLAGCGNMGYAMLSGWVKSGRLAPEDVWVVEPNEALRRRAAELGSNPAENSSELPANLSPVLAVLAVKPQVMREVAGGYKRFADGRTTFLSIAAGTPIATFEEILGAVPVIRCMPNTPAAIGKGMMVTFANQLVPDATRDFVNALLSASGEVTAVNDEGLMDAVTAVSGLGTRLCLPFHRGFDRRCQECRPAG